MPISGHQLIQEKISKMYVAIDGARMLNFKAAMLKVSE
jgi:alkylation response protein AidB-like acyl-CoA dehydrogenase